MIEIGSEMIKRKVSAAKPCFLVKKREVERAFFMPRRASFFRPCVSSRTALDGLSWIAEPMFLASDSSGRVPACLLSCDPGPSQRQIPVGKGPYFSEFPSVPHRRLSQLRNEVELVFSSPASRRLCSLSDEYFPTEDTRHSWL